MIRPARADDVPRLAEIERLQPGSAGWSAEQIEQERLRPASAAWVAEEEGRAAGFAVFREAPAEAQVLDVAVHPAFTRRGLGRALMDALEKEARRRGLAKMTLEVEATNAPALSLYRSRGFREVGRRPNFYGPGRHALLMDLNLEDLK